MGQAEKMNFIADTNVWYDIAAGRRDPRMLKSTGNRLIATPTSFMEISSLINEQNFDDRRKAAQAVVEHADEVAVDCEFHLATLWKLPVTDPGIQWAEGFTAIAEASSASQLQAGVEDFHRMVKRTVNVSLTNEWRAYHWDDFRNEVVDAIDEYVPGYKAARARGQCKHLNKENGEAFASALRSREAREVIVGATFSRALLVANQAFRKPSQSEYNWAEPLVSPYVDAYIEYLIGCATEFAPQPNDLGDSECFLYLQDGRVFLSSDKRWVRIARKVCPAHFLDPEMKVP
jgi:hypothetical protein